MTVLEKLRERVKNGLLLNTVYRVLIRKKIKIDLFYLVQENPSLAKNLYPELKLSPFEICELESSDIRIIAAKAERDYSEERMLAMLASGRKCLGIKYNSEIVAYGWINLDNCQSHLLAFPLNKNEAYLYGLRTFQTHRGRNLATYLRHQMYTLVTKMGREKVYSIVKFENIESIKINKKLGALVLKLIITIKLLNKYQWSFVLRNYNSSS